ncbi:hypothetical protein FQR65_LT20250 [Abscondita terminalis]|nr:hypothetical protein FQR65_LT20250 [Abscondita terminalis]
MSALRETDFTHHVYTKVCFSPGQRMTIRLRHSRKRRSRIEVTNFGEIDLLALVVQDEIILSLPVVRCMIHEHCEVPRRTWALANLPEEAKKPNPFAVLASLKQKVVGNPDDITHYLARATSNTFAFADYSCPVTSMRVALDVVKQGRAEACVKCRKSPRADGLALNCCSSPLQDIDAPGAGDGVPHSARRGKTDHAVQFAVHGVGDGGGSDWALQTRDCLLNIGEEEIRGPDSILTPH